MNRQSLKPHAPLLVLAALVWSCSGPAENSGSTNSNASPPQASANPSRPPVAGDAPPVAAPAPTVVVPSVQPTPAPVKPAEAAPAPVQTPAAPSASPAAGLRVPKLITPEKTMDFGKQPQDKTMVRAIAIRNAGKADLNIESVVPS